MLRPLFARRPPPPEHAPRFPDWVLLDTVVRGANYDWEKMSIAQCSASLATTARTFVDVKSEAESQEEVVVEVEVSFLFVSPPEVSGFIVHVGDNGLSYGACVVSTDGDAVLLAITMAKFKKRRYLVYKAGHGNPSLEVLPYPPKELPQTQVVGILSHSEGYVVAALIRQHSTNISAAYTYKLFLYSSQTKIWSNKVVQLKRKGFREADRTHIIGHKTTKVITVGVDSLGWVDLWHGIISCNLLQEDPDMRFYNFPGPMNTNAFNCGAIPPRSVRDVIWTGNTLRLVEVEYNQDAGHSDYGWKAITKHNNQGARWMRQLDVDSGNILLPEENWDLLWQSHTLPDDVPQAYPLSKLECFAPTLGIDDNILYMMSRPFESEKKPFSLFAAVDMSNNDARLVSFSTERMTYVDPNYCPCTVSRYFNTASGLNIIGGNLRWIGLVKLAVLRDILAAIETLKSLDEKLMKLERPDETQLRICSSSIERLNQMACGITSYVDNMCTTNILCHVSKLEEEFSRLGGKTVPVMDKDEYAMLVDSMHFKISSVIEVAPSLVKALLPKRLDDPLYSLRSVERTLKYGEVPLTQYLRRLDLLEGGP